MSTFPVINENGVMSVCPYLRKVKGEEGGGDFVLQHNEFSTKPVRGDFCCKVYLKLFFYKCFTQ